MKMQYNSYYPYQTFPQNYFQQPYQQPIPQVNQPVQTQTVQQPNQTVQQIQPQIQNGGFISVRNETEARNYPIAPGNSITFKDENAPFVYVKTMGFSQLDRPVFERFQLVKMEGSVSETNATAQQTEPINLPDYATKDEYNALRTDVDGIKSKLEEMEKNQTTKKTVKKSEVKEDE